jgi:sugar/nucleoside kinase (ribokinase family)
LLPQIDLLMLNDLSLSSLLELPGDEVVFEAFRQRAPGTCVAMSMGARGAWLGRGEQQARVPAFPVQALDTTGAGDAFHAGLIYGLLLQDWPLLRAGQFASALAAFNCTGLGARGGLVGCDEAAQFLREQGLET